MDDPSKRREICFLRRLKISKLYEKNDGAHFETIIPLKL